MTILHICYIRSNWKTSDNCSSNGRIRVREDTTHINGIEGFWSYAKTWIYHYRGVPKQYFHLYLKEIEFRFNHRDEDLFQILANIVVKAVPNS